MPEEENSRELLTAIKQMLVDSERRWEDHMTEHRDRDSKIDKFIGGAERALAGGNKRFESIEKQIPKPKSLASEWPKLLGLVGAAFGLWRTLATMDYVKEFVDYHNHSDMAHPSITRAIDEFSKEQKAMHQNILELAGKPGADRRVP